MNVQDNRSTTAMYLLHDRSHQKMGGLTVFVIAETFCLLSLALKPIFGWIQCLTLFDCPSDIVVDVQKSFVRLCTLLLSLSM